MCLTFIHPVSCARISPLYSIKRESYCLALSKSFYIDAALFRGVGASANGSKNGVRPNAKFVVNARSKSARLEACRPISPGEEVLVSYGATYWRGSHKSSSYMTSNVPQWEWDLSDPFSAADSLNLNSPRADPDTLALPVHAVSSSPP